jgi:hypothetical protein
VISAPDSSINQWALQEVFMVVDFGGDELGVCRSNAFAFTGTMERAR